MIKQNLRRKVEKEQIRIWKHEREGLPETFRGEMAIQVSGRANGGGQRGEIQKSSGPSKGGGALPTVARVARKRLMADGNPSPPLRAPRHDSPMGSEGGRACPRRDESNDAWAWHVESFAPRDEGDAVGGARLSHGRGTVCSRSRPVAGARPGAIVSKRSATQRSKAASRSNRSSGHVVRSVSGALCIVRDAVRGDIGQKGGRKGGCSSRPSAGMGRSVGPHEPSGPCPRQG